MPIDRAVIDAGAVRFRPMMLTAAAVIVGSSVILFDPIFQGLAIALMAGEIASLLLSRMTVPVLFFVFSRRRTAEPPRCRCFASGVHSVQQFRIEKRYGWCQIRKDAEVTRRFAALRTNLLGPPCTWVAFLFGCFPRTEQNFLYQGRLRFKPSGPPQRTKRAG